MTRSIDLRAYADGVLAGDRSYIARAITLVESTRPDHRRQAQELLSLLPGPAEPTRRVGISGVPGAGKSTFIDALGTALTAAGHKVAVLAVDPSSTRTGGSILGDKTRMASLAVDPAAFVRPSPSAGTLGGVARATREAMAVVEAAGYDVVLVETVGVGQSETTVAEMTDTFLLLALARAGDQLQGIKRGVLELADVIAINKADGPHAAEAARTARDTAAALRLLRGPVEAGGWRIPVLTCSALEKTGLDEVWSAVSDHFGRLASSGELAERRARQQRDWLWSLVRDRLQDELHHHPAVASLTPSVEAAVTNGELTPSAAADQLLAAFTHPGTLSAPPNGERT